MQEAVTTTARARISDREARYLLAILARGGNEVRSVDLALHLGVQKSSVSAMLSRLVAHDLVWKESYGKVSLTDAGRERAVKLRDSLRETEEYLARTLALSGEHLEKVALAMVLAGGSCVVQAIRATASND